MKKQKAPKLISLTQIAYQNYLKLYNRRYNELVIEEFQTHNEKKAKEIAMELTNICLGLANTQKGKRMRERWGNHARLWHWRVSVPMAEWNTIKDYITFGLLAVKESDGTID